MANAAWNPADLTAVTLSGSNLTATATATTSGVRATLSAGSGKYYFEFHYTVLTGNFGGLGLATGAATVSGPGTGTVGLQLFGTRIAIAGAASGVTCRYVAPHWGRVAVDLGAQKLWIGDVTVGDWNNDTAGTTQNPATGLGGVSLSTVGTTLFPWACFTATSDSVGMNFGDSAFQGSVPSGFTAGWLGASAAPAQARALILA